MGTTVTSSGDSSNGWTLHEHDHTLSPTQWAAYIRVDEGAVFSPVDMKLYIFDFSSKSFKTQDVTAGVFPPSGWEAVTNEYIHAGRNQVAGLLKKISGSSVIEEIGLLVSESDENFARTSLPIASVSSLTYYAGKDEGGADVWVPVLSPYSIYPEHVGSWDASEWNWIRFQYRPSPPTSARLQINYTPNYTDVYAIGLWDLGANTVSVSAVLPADFAGLHQGSPTPGAWEPFFPFARRGWRTDHDESYIPVSETNPTVDSLRITSIIFPDAAAGSPYAAACQAAGGSPPYSWTGEGLPNDLEIDSSGVISGTVSDGYRDGASVNFSATVTDSSDPQQSARLSGTIFIQNLSEPTPLSFAPTLPDNPGEITARYVLADGEPASIHVTTVSGGASPYAYLIQGLPNGLTFDASTGDISGTLSDPDTKDVDCLFMVLDSNIPPLEKFGYFGFSLNP